MAEFNVQYVFVHILSIHMNQKFLGRALLLGWHFRRLLSWRWSGTFVGTISGALEAWRYQP